MGKFISLTAADGQALAAWLSEPAGPPKASIVVLQEIFGVNSHIRDVTDRWAALGYRAIAPALFDRIEPHFDAGYEADDRQRAMAMIGKLDMDKALLDIAAAIAYAPKIGKTGIVGFCLGGLLSWLAACRLTCEAAIAYYPGRIGQFKDEQPHCPVMMNFGLRDSHIPQDQVEGLRLAHPEIPIHLYDADHGFSCDQRGSFDAPSAELAWRRSVDFFATHLAG